MTGGHEEVRLAATVRSADLGQLIPYRSRHCEITESPDLPEMLVDIFRRRCPQRGGGGIRFDVRPWDFFGTGDPSSGAASPSSPCK